MWERSRGFIIKAGTIIFTVCVLIWFLSKFNFALNIVEVEESMLAAIGHSVAWLFAPLGLGDWKGAVAIISAEMAKEQAIGTLAILSGVADPGNDELVMTGIKTMFTPMAAFSFMVLNLFDPPCIVAIATIIREMNSKKWATIAIGYQIVIGYALAMVVYQLGSWFFYGAPFGVGQGVAIFLLVLALYFIVRPEPRLRGSVLGLDE
jgi:ferrous iron transport protein B